MTKLNRSVMRAMDVLGVITTFGPVPLAFIAARTGLSKATILRLCATLEAKRWLIRRTGDGFYQVGSGFPAPGQDANPRDHLVEIAKDIIIDLSERTGHGVDLAGVVDVGRIEIIDTTRHFERHAIYPHCIGFRPSPFCSALCLAYLVALPDDELARTIETLSANVVKHDMRAFRAFPEIMRAIKARGYAQREQEHWGHAVDFGMMPMAIAVPVLQGATPIGAINLVWADKDHTIDAVVSRHLGDLQEAARRIGARCQMS